MDLDLSIYAKVALLLTMSMSLGGFGCWLARNKASLAWFVMTFIGFLGGVFVVQFMAASSPEAGISALAAWTFISGLFMGPAIHAYSEEIGWKTVALAFFGTAGVMAICGLFATFSGINFAPMGAVLGFGLFGLIIVGVIGLFFRWGRDANLLYSCFGMVLFAGYFVYDFFTLGHTENSWQHAIQMTMKIYLDYMNFLLHLLSFLAAHHHH